MYHYVCEYELFLREQNKDKWHLLGMRRQGMLYCKSRCFVPRISKRGKKINAMGVME